MDIDPILNQLRDLILVKDDPDSPLYGLDRGDTSYPECYRCVASCCASSRILGLEMKEMELLLQHGDVPVALIPTGNPELDARQLQDLNDLRQLSRYKNIIVAPVTIPLVGPCPLLTNEGICSVYESRPIGCRAFEMGGEACRALFIERGSEAAHVVEQMVNGLEPYMRLLATQLMGVNRIPRNYDFVPLGDIGVNS